MKEVKFGYYDQTTVRAGVVPETDRTPEVKYTYNPLTIENSSMLDGELMAEESANGVMLTMLKIITTAIVSWNLKKPDRDNPDSKEGVAVDPKNIDELKRVDPYIIERIVEDIKATPVIAEAKAKN